jgi:AcrR family transcriptional regulator
MATEPPPSKVTPAEAFERARALIRAGEKLDMVAFAADLGISRATLYRWTGDRERLLADIVWADLQEMFTYLLARDTGRGRARIHAIATAFLELLTTRSSLPSFLRNEGENGLRLVTDPDGDVHPRIVEALAELIAMEVAEGHYRAPDDPHLLADGIVTLGERFLYNGGAARANPDPAMAVRVMDLLLREDPPAKA